MQYTGQSIQHPHEVQTPPASPTPSPANPSSDLDPALVDLWRTFITVSTGGLISQIASVSRSVLRRLHLLKFGSKVAATVIHAYRIGSDLAKQTHKIGIACRENVSVVYIRPESLDTARQFEGSFLIDGSVCPTSTIFSLYTLIYPAHQQSLGFEGFETIRGTPPTFKRLEDPVHIRPLSTRSGKDTRVFPPQTVVVLYKEPGTDAARDDPRLNLREKVFLNEAEKKILNLDTITDEPPPGQPKIFALGFAHTRSHPVFTPTFRRLRKRLRSILYVRRKFKRGAVRANAPGGGGIGIGIRKDHHGTIGCVDINPSSSCTG